MHSAPPTLGKVLHQLVQITYPLVGGGGSPFPMHFYHVFNGILMVEGGFWPLAATSMKVLERCCYILQMHKTVFPQSGQVPTTHHSRFA